MKKINLSLFIASGIFLAACSSNGVETSDAKKEAKASVDATIYDVIPDQSQVIWHGKKLAYGHTGLISIQAGNLSFEGEKLTAGKFTIDMHSIVETGNPNDEDAAKLAGHLMDADFFDADQFPVSTFEITEVKQEKNINYTISGNLTIKGVTKNITFPAKIVLDGDQVTASAEFVINRNDWGVSYGSGITGAVADQAIHDDIDFKISLVAKK